MNKTKLTLIVAVALFAAMACKKEDTTPNPVANFTITSNDSLFSNETFAFTNTSENATTYRWDFGDGTFVTTTNATKNYTTFNPILTAVNGYNTVVIKLTAKNAKGDSSVVTKNIVVINP